MAECGSWPSIAARGLLSTTASLDMADVSPQEREKIESTKRPTKTVLTLRDAHAIVLRDQKPMSDKRLATCLTGGATPREWYEFLNAKTFFWATEARLHTLLNAYGGEEHDVLQINTESLVAAHENEIWLCHMNSGNTTPWAHPRGFDVFYRIADYPVKASGQPKKEVAEVVLDYSVLDISNHVENVQRMKAGLVTNAKPY